MLLIIEALLFLAALGQDHRAAAQDIPLDMAPDSADDMYFGCREKMAHLVETEYLEKELKNLSYFGDAWKNAKNVISKWPILRKFAEILAVGRKLKSTHKIAIRVYTNNSVYGNFNRETRTGKQSYKDNTYKWYSLHFLLTEAIQILKKQQNRCFDTFRGSNGDFNGNVFEDVRFGSFASSSLNRAVAEGFGTKTCFEIHTCEGANVTKYSEFPYEQEVLIPPYEKFNVIAVERRTQDQNGVRQDLWCQTVYTLESSGIRSDLNCALFNKH